MHTYTKCKHCDFFTDENYQTSGLTGLAEHVHLSSGEYGQPDPDADHNAEPSEQTHTIEEWKKIRPDLYVMHADGFIGPNSKHHKGPGKITTGIVD